MSILGSQLCRECGDYPCRSVVCPAFYLTFASVFSFAFHWKSRRILFLAGGCSIRFERVCREQCIDDFWLCVDCRDIVFSDAGPFFGFYVSALLKLYAPSLFIGLFAVCHDGGFLSAPQKYCQAVAGGFSQAQLRLGWLMALVLQTLVTGR